LPSFEIIDPEGQRHTLDIKPGRSLLQAIQAAGIDGLLAECGGNCSCATCHVQFERPGADELPAPSIDESAMLDCALYVTPGSRLACQIRVSNALDGSRIVILRDQR